MTQLTKLKIVVLGGKGVGKSAVIVRILTRRYIGEYQSNIDILYKKEYNLDESIVHLEILDISSNKGNSSSTFHDNILWANGFVILYDLCDKSSFQVAQQYLELVNSMRGFVHSPILLLANKRDLEQGRKVSLMEGRNLAAKYGAHFFEVSAADSYVGVQVSFDALIRELVSSRLRRSARSPSSSSNSHLTNYKKLSIVTVSKVFGAVFGTNSNNGSANSSNGKHNSDNSVYYSNIDLINSTQQQCSNSDGNNGGNGSKSICHQQLTLPTSTTNNSTRLNSPSTPTKSSADHFNQFFNYDSNQNNYANLLGNNNKENKFKKCVPLLNSRSFCRSKKSTHATMIKVTRKSSPPILSL